MKLYRLHIAPGEDAGEGEDHDEWFRSLRAAKRRRAELIGDNPLMEGHRYGVDYEIDCYEWLGRAGPLALLLDTLKRRFTLAQITRVVPPYKPARRDP